MPRISAARDRQAVHRDAAVTTRRGSDGGQRRDWQVTPASGAGAFPTPFPAAPSNQLSASGRHDSCRHPASSPMAAPAPASLRRWMGRAFSLLGERRHLRSQVGSSCRSSADEPRPVRTAIRCGRLGSLRVPCLRSRLALGRRWPDAAGLIHAGTPAAYRCPNSIFGPVLRKPSGGQFCDALPLKVSLMVQPTQRPGRSVRCSARRRRSIGCPLHSPRRAAWAPVLPLTGVPVGCGARRWCLPTGRERRGRRNQQGEDP